MLLEQALMVSRISRLEASLAAAACNTLSSRAVSSAKAILLSQRDSMWKLPGSNRTA